MRSLAVFFAGCFLLSLTSGSLGAEKIRVAFVSPSPTQSPSWIAKETGLFTKYGLDAEIVLLPGSPRMVQTLIAGDIDYAIVGATAAMRARMRGADVVILATTANFSNMKVLTSRDSGIRHFRGRRILGAAQLSADPCP